eukprot:gene8449-9351_t
MELKVRGAVLSAFFISTVVILSAANFVLVLNIKRHNVVLRKTELETMKTNIGKIQPKNVVLPELTVVRPLAKSCDLNDPPLEMSKQQDTTNQNLRLQNRPKKGMLSNSEIPVHDKDNQDLQDKEMSEFRVEISTTPQSFSNTKNNSTVVTLQENTASERQKVRLAARERTEIKATTMCICIVALFTLCWTPLIVYRLHYVHNAKGFRLPWFRRLALCLASSNSLLNPCIYLLVRKDFRNYLPRFCENIFQCK